MPKISDERRAERRAQIIEAAWTCFQNQGLHATTMDDIIRASSLSAGAVYGYFKSKDELIGAGLGAAMSGLREALLPILARRPPPSMDALAMELAEAIIAFSRQKTHDRRRIHILGLGEAQRNAAFAASLRSYYRGFRGDLEGVAAAWLGEAQAAGSDDGSKAIAKVLMSLLLGFVIQSVVLEDVTPDDLARGLRALGMPRREGP